MESGLTAISAVAGIMILMASALMLARSLALRDGDEGFAFLIMAVGGLVIFAPPYLSSTIEKLETESASESHPKHAPSPSTGQSQQRDSWDVPEWMLPMIAVVAVVVLVATCVFLIRRSIRRGRRDEAVPDDLQDAVHDELQDAVIDLPN